MGYPNNIHLNYGIMMCFTKHLFFMGIQWDILWNHMGITKHEWFFMGYLMESYYDYYGDNQTYSSDLIWFNGISWQNCGKEIHHFEVIESEFVNMNRCNISIVHCSSLHDEWCLHTWYMSIYNICVWTNTVHPQFDLCLGRYVCTWHVYNYVYLRTCTYLSNSVNTCLITSIYLPIYLSTYLTIYLSNLT